MQFGRARSLDMPSSPSDVEKADPSIAEAVLQIWKEVFQFDEIDLNSDFFDLGGNSLTASKLQAKFKKKFGIGISSADILRLPKLADMAEEMESATEASRRIKVVASNPNVIPLQPEGKGRPLFVISQSLIFRKMALQLGADQPVYTVVMNDEDPVSNLSSFDEIVNFHLQLIRSVQPNGPYRLAGWCVSGWIGYGIARKLEELGEKIELLTVIDVVAPGYFSHCGWSTKLIYNWRRFRVARKTTSTLQLILKRLVKTEKAEEDEIADKLDDTASQAQFLGPLQGNMLLFCSDEDPIQLLPHSMGWENLLGRSIPVIPLPGNHHQIFENPGARIMAQAISNQLRETNA